MARGGSGMIDKHFGEYVLVCDICEEEAGERWETFQDAVEGKKKLGWKSQNAGNGWEDVCPSCQKKE
jgi:hypothetical protein